MIGSLAYFATDVAEPGVIHHTEGNRISFGEPDGSKSDRAKAIAEPLIAERESAYCVRPELGAESRGAPPAHLGGVRMLEALPAQMLPPFACSSRRSSDEVIG